MSDKYLCRFCDTTTDTLLRLIEHYQDCHQREWDFERDIRPYTLGTVAPLGIGAEFALIPVALIAVAIGAGVTWRLWEVGHLYALVFGFVAYLVALFVGVFVFMVVQAFADARNGAE